MVWCFKKNLNRNDVNSFNGKNLQIFWIMGPPSCGKTTLAEMLAKSSNYYLIKIKFLLLDEVAANSSQGKIIYDCMSKARPVPNYIVVHLIKELLVRTHQHWPGYIIDGFPINFKQAKYFEKKIRKSNLIIYVTLVLDALLARKLSERNPINPYEVRINHIRYTKRLKKICKKFEYKTIHLYCNYPPEDTCTRLIENLEDFWGYKFLHLYNKNQ